ncbi:penicillin-binding protein [Listeria cornellensis FSL F6-0969]|uniref:Penicillin-binding protein n=1 Tax=Listeria cornellensis FSL F6-0969 TaxID=1265820 RepID=W7C0B9_9LIST|nr:penicillin-binding protein [Listeria cornellensis FSL F6-0969]
MYTAVAKSINAPAVWLLDQIGLQKGVDSVKRFGIQLTKEDEYLGLTLGGLNKGVSPVELATAYATFANGGAKPESHIIRKIVDPTGKVVYENEESKKQIISKKVSTDMTSMLIDVINNGGTGENAGVSGYEMAGKTGSTQVPFTTDGTKDQWFVGYTPELVGSVWIGFDKTDEAHYLKTKSSDGVASLAHYVMKSGLKYQKPVDFGTKSASAKTEEKNQENAVTEQAGDFWGSIKDSAKGAGETIKKRR